MMCWPVTPKRGNVRINDCVGCADQWPQSEEMQELATMYNVLTSDHKAYIKRIAANLPIPSWMSKVMLF